MRVLLIAMALAGCGSTPAQPARYVPEDEDTGPTRVASAPVDAQWTPRPVPSTPPVAAEEAPVDAGAVADTASVVVSNPDDFYENGVRILRVDAPHWCSTGKDGNCTATERECRDSWRKCKPANTWACFEFKGSSLGPQCMTTLDACQKARLAKLDYFAEDFVGECTVGRLKGAIDTTMASAPDGDPDVFEEGGVQVLIVDKPAWCVASGYFAGVCSRTPAHCKKMGKGCRRATAWACFEATQRTSGQTEEPCAATYEGCNTLRNVMSESAEYVDITACTIMRLRRKK